MKKIFQISKGYYIAFACGCFIWGLQMIYSSLSNRNYILIVDPIINILTLNKLDEELVVLIGILAMPISTLFSIVFEGRGISIVFVTLILTIINGLTYVLYLALVKVCLICFRFTVSKFFPKKVENEKIDY